VNSYSFNLYNFFSKEPNLTNRAEYYPKIITTRSYDERLETIGNVRDAGISVCSGGIIGLGETDADRIGMLHTLANLPEHPESVPINALLAVEGTPLEDKEVRLLFFDHSSSLFFTYLIVKYLKIFLHNVYTAC
jgi:biotin synthase-like enzyme